MRRLEEIKKLWKSENNTEKYSFDGFLDRSDVDWLIRRVEKLEKLIRKYMMRIE